MKNKKFVAAKRQKEASDKSISSQAKDKKPDKTNPKYRKPEQNYDANDELHDFSVHVEKGDQAFPGQGNEFGDDQPEKGD